MIQPDPTIRAAIAADGFSVVRSAALRSVETAEAWRRFSEDWQHLETDLYMADGGRYRLRRFGRFFFRPAADELVRLPHATVFQSRYINNFAGGIHRDFAPLRESTFADPFLLALIRFDFACFETPEPSMLADPWEVWVHQIRIEASGDSTVLPAPEGIHHDGHDFIAMHLVGRENVAGGRSFLYDNDERRLLVCRLNRPLDTIYADDHRVMHAVAAIRPADSALPARRDMLIIDYDHKPLLQHPG